MGSDLSAPEEVSALMGNRCSEIEVPEDADCLLLVSDRPMLSVIVISRTGYGVTSLKHGIWIASSTGIGVGHY